MELWLIACKQLLTRGCEEMRVSVKIGLGSFTSHCIIDTVGYSLHNELQTEISNVLIIIMNHRAMGLQAESTVHDMDPL